VNRRPRSPEVLDMTTAAEQEVLETELERVERWRAEELMRAGYEPDAAADLAVRPDIDLHTAIDLLERGCPADLAVRILL
jgi:hypothetical protein